MDFSEKHRNWLEVGEMFPLIQKPVSAYVDEIVKDFHMDLCNDFDKSVYCTNRCCKKVNPNLSLCSLCQKWWLKKLEAAHKKGKNPSWSNNCNGEKWYDDYWEVAKFFMPSLGNNRLTVKDSNSTELSALLNVIEWMKDKALLGKTRVDLKHAQNLRSEVRNTWAHAASQELSNPQKVDYFDIATNFLDDLRVAYPSGITEIEQTKEDLENLKTIGVSDPVRSMLENLLLKSSLLKGMKEELNCAREDRLSNKEAISDLNAQLQEVKQLMDDCQEKIKAFAVHSQDGYLPDKIINFVAREKEINDVIKLFQEEDISVIALHGGPGFGKSALAIELSYRLTNLHNRVVYFNDLNTALTINEVIRLLCRDLGVNHDEDPKSSLILWLKKVSKQIVFVLDDIDKLLQPQTRSDLDEFICLLRKHSNQKLKIITTSRISYEITSVSKFQKCEIKEMDEKSGMALLKSLYSNGKEDFSKRLCRLCGFVPLAMCIAASLVNEYDDPYEILPQLQQQPMKTLNNSETNQFVCRAFNTSFRMLNQEQKCAILRLTIFQGDFNEDAAKAVLDGDDLDRKAALRDLVKRSLVKKSGKRYSIHLLIKSFLIDQLDSVQKREEAEKLMVKHFLDLCAKLTTDSYAKDGFLRNREILKGEVHNIENVLGMCSDIKNSEISTILTKSDMYQSSCRFFYNIVKHIVSETVLNTFIQACSDLAELNEERANEVNFGCLLADIEGRKSLAWDSEEYIRKITETREKFQNHKECFPKNFSLHAYFYFQIGRYTLNQFKRERNSNASELGDQAKEYLCDSLDSRKKLPESPMAKTDVILSLMQLGNLWKVKSSKRYGQNDPFAKEDGKKCVLEAEEYYKEAVNEARNYLGKHELTSWCHKLLGDLLLQSWQNEEALECYEFARHMREEMSLNTNEKYVFLLNNIGRCLKYLDRDADAIKTLEEARCIAENLVESDTPTAIKGRLYTSLALTYKKSTKTFAKAKEFAERSLEMNAKMRGVIITRKEVTMLKDIFTNQFRLSPTETISNRYSSMIMVIVLVIAIVVAYMHGLI